MIISGGSNIYPREIEEVLLRHPDLVEASVVGRPHREWGEEVVAFVVARSGAEIAAETLDRLCLDHIARFKRPRLSTGCASIISPASSGRDSIALSTRYRKTITAKC